MSKIIKFPHDKVSIPEPTEIKPDPILEELTPRHAPSAVWAWIWNMVRVPLFLMLYWLRVPVMLVCNLVAYPFMLAWLFTWFVYPDKTVMVWGFAALSFGAFVVTWLYDSLLMALSPNDVQRTL